MIKEFYTKVKPILKKMLLVAAILAGIFLGFYAGRYSQKPKTIEEALLQAEEVCMKEMLKNGDFKQVHLNSCSAYIVDLSQMRLDWQMLAVENSPDYDKIEKEYIKWHEKRQKLHLHPEVPENIIPGSIKVMEKNLESAARNQKEIEELEKFKKR